LPVAARPIAHCELGPFAGVMYCMMYVFVVYFVRNETSTEYTILDNNESA